MKKRISLILAIMMLALVFCTVPFAASAEGTTDAEVIYLYEGEVEPLVKTWTDAAAMLESEGEHTVYLLKDITIESSVNVKANLTVYGNGHIISVKEGMGNVFRLTANDVVLTINNVTITGNAAGPENTASSCIFQLINAGTVVNLNDVTMTALNAKYYIINVMGNDGLARTVNLNRVTAVNGITAGNAFLSGGNAAGSAGADHTNHIVLNITDSYITHNKRVLQVNKGSTAAITLNNSTLELVEGAAADSAVVRLYNPVNLLPDQIDTISLTATNSLIKCPANCVDFKYDDVKDDKVTVDYTPGIPTEVTNATYTDYTPATEVPDTTTAEAPATTTTAEAPATTTTAEAPATTTATAEAPATTTANAPEADTTTKAPDAATTTKAPVATTEAPDAGTTAAPEAEGDCAGCGGIAIAAQLVALVCAAAVVIIKKK